MACERYLNAIHELIDGTLGPIRRAELELHLESCDECRALVGDLREIARATESLEDIVPPPQVWSHIAARLQQEGRVQPVSTRAPWQRNRTVLALAATLVLAVGASLFVLWPRPAPTPAAPGAATAATPSPTAGGNEAAGNADPVDPVQSFDAELAKTDAQLTRVYEQATKLDDSLDPETKADIQKSLLVMNEAAKDIRSRLKTDPQDAIAQQSLYETLKQKIQFLQNTITLMNEMRQGDAAGAAQVVEGGKS